MNPMNRNNWSVLGYVEVPDKEKFTSNQVINVPTRSIIGKFDTAEKRWPRFIG
jgi:hypothetical protein